jgi:hypothetical protein
MTELEKIKSDIAQLVNRIDELQNKSDEDVFIFNKEQLLKYTMSILEQNVDEIKTTIRGIDFDGDEFVELDMNGGGRYGGGYSIEINIDNDAIQHTVVNEIDCFEITEETVEPFMIDALGNIGYFEKKDESVGQ